MLSSLFISTDNLALNDLGYTNVVIFTYKFKNIGKVEYIVTDA